MDLSSGFWSWGPLEEASCRLVLRPPSPVSSPQGEDMPERDFRLAEDYPSNPVVRYSKNAAYFSPSPGGEGPGEDGRQTPITFSLSGTTIHLFHCQKFRASCNSALRVIRSHCRFANTAFPIIIRRWLRTDPTNCLRAIRIPRGSQFPNFFPVRAIWRSRPAPCPFPR